MNGEFLDTNILVYAHDRTAGKKRDVALELLLRLMNTDKGLLSVQVLMEFYTTVTRKIPSPLHSEIAEGIIEDLLTWNIYSPMPNDIRPVIQLSRRHQISFWDAFVIHAAIKMQASVIWSEDLNTGQEYEGVVVRNPFG